MSVTFDPAAHIIRLGDRQIPSVTTILREAGIVDPGVYAPGSAHRGTCVHTATHFFDEGDLDWDSLDPEIVGYVESYRLWRERNPVAWDEIERPRVHRNGTYAGIPDRVRFAEMLVDIKSGQPEPWHLLQLAAYADLHEQPHKFRLIGLYLHKDGSYPTEREADRTQLYFNLRVFQAAVAIQNWKAVNR